MKTIKVPDNIYNEVASFVEDTIKLHRELKRVKLIEKCEKFQNWHEDPATFDILKEVIEFLKEIGD